jgi:hypothetical protein
MNRIEGEYSKISKTKTGIKNLRIGNKCKNVLDRYPKTSESFRSGFVGVSAFTTNGADNHR